MVADPSVARSRSMETFAAIGLPEMPSHLPLLDPPTAEREPLDLAQRMGVLSAVAAVSYGLDRGDARNWLLGESLLDLLSPTETALVVDGQPRGDEILRPEAVFGLAWAGLLVEEDILAACPDDLVLVVPRPPSARRAARAVADVATRTRVRSLDQLMVALDLLFCLHWSAVDARLTQRPITAPLPESVARERRWALEWVLYDEPWDEVDLST